MRIALTCVVISIILTGCFNFKRAPMKGKDTHYETFLVDEGITQYFIKPLTYTSGEVSFKVDYTFRDSVNSQSFITCNYSLFTPEKVSVEQVIFHTDSSSFSAKNSERIYLKKDEKFHYRATSDIRYRNLIQLLEAGKTRVQIGMENTNRTLTPEKETKDKYTYMRANLLPVIPQPNEN